MLEFCKALAVPICLLTPFWYEDDDGLEHLLVESINCDVDIFRTTAIEMQVLK